jgi:hypothetical protein
MNHTRIIWFCRHEPLPSQIAELRRLFGPDAEIIRDLDPFPTADEIYSRFRTHRGDEMVVLSSLSVLQRLCELGLKPLWVSMEVVTRAQADLVTAGRGYRFQKFQRVEKVEVKFSELPAGPSTVEPGRITGAQPPKNTS